MALVFLPLFRVLAVLAMLGAALVAARPAHATEFCVDTPAELAGALGLSQFRQPDGELTIRIETGSYDLQNHDFFTVYVHNRLRLLGGYGNDCLTRDANPAATVLDFGGHLFRLNSIGDAITVEGLHLRHFRFMDVASRGNCEASGDTITFRRNIVESLRQDSSLYLNAKCHDLQVDNNLVIGGGGVRVEAGAVTEGLQAVVANNTIVGSAHRGLEIGSFESEPLVFRVYNNIFWGNAGPGLDVDAGAAVMAFNNSWNSRAGALLGNIGNSTADPMLLATHRLQTGSPSINSGFNAVPGGLPASDNDGGARRIGSAVDRGAFESVVDDSFTLVVTNANDSGAGSLRQAILNANADPAFNRIEFDIPTASGQCAVLQPASPYPDITASVLIDGTSQPGSAVNTLQHGDNATICVRILHLGTPMLRALQVPDDAAPDVTLTVQGLAFGGFGAAVRLLGGRDHLVFGNHFGVGVANLFPGNTNGLVSLAPGTQVGGIEPSTRNVFAGNLAGISIRGAGARVVNNYIGTTRDGRTGDPDGSYANGYGIYLHGEDDILVANNVISGNGTGINVTSHSATVLSGNRIGLRALPNCVVLGPSCSNAVPNRVGVHFEGAASLTSNAIAFNREDGVEIRGSNNAGARLSGNRIFSNGALGIDIYGADAPDGPNPELYNGVGANPMPNHGQNAPLLVTASGSGDVGQVHGSLRSGNGTFRVELFSSAACDASGHGEGQQYHGHTSVTVTDADSANLENGEAAFSIDIARGDAVATLAGRAITATATRGDGSTSEFSSCVTYVDDGSAPVLFADGFED